jgi:hypothetical protein
MIAPEGTLTEPSTRFRTCAQEHGLSLHRIHVLAPGKTGGFASTVIFNCTCGQRWLLRTGQAEVVSVDADLIEELRRGRDGQPTAPPGFPAGRKP